MSVSRLRFISSIFQSQFNVNKGNIQNLFVLFEKKSIPTLRNYSSQSSHIIQMRGLEQETKEQDIIDFFKPLGIIPKAVHLKFDGAGRVAGVSEVEFATHAEAVVAMRKKNAFMANRFIRLTLKSAGLDDTAPLKKSDASKEVTKESTEKSDSAKFNISENIVRPAYHTGHIIKMKNVPRRMTDQQIYDFFWPVGASPLSIKPKYNESGLRTGEFEVQFLTKNDAIRAMAKNNAYFRKKFVELSLVKQS